MVTEIKIRDRKNTESSGVTVRLDDGEFVRLRCFGESIDVVDGHDGDFLVTAASFSVEELNNLVIEGDIQTIKGRKIFTDGKVSILDEKSDELIEVEYLGSRKS